MKIFKFLFLSLIIFSQICLSQTDPKINEIITTIQKKYVPDKRTGVFKIETELTDGKLLLKGETDNSAALDALLLELRSGQNPPIENKILMLPDSALHGKNYAVVCVSVANMRKDHDHEFEMVSQSLLGTELKVLKKKSGFYYVQTPDKYLGWIESGSLKLFDEKSVDEWRKAKKAIYTDLFGLIYSGKNKKSDPVMDIVAGSTVKLISKGGAWWKVLTPDGRTGFLPKEQVQDKDKWDKTRKLNFTNIFKTAKRFLGFPYLWGGFSSKGLDCSGFVKTVFNLNGMLLPRDASQQALVGEEIIPEKDYKNVKPGDLLFFGGKDKEGKLKVTHVAIYVKDYNFIHCSSYVQISSLEKDAENFDPYHSDRLVKIMRIIK
jgi:hypothetical protein